MWMGQKRLEGKSSGVFAGAVGAAGLLGFLYLGIWERHISDGRF